MYISGVGCSIIICVRQEQGWGKVQKPDTNRFIEPFITSNILVYSVKADTLVEERNSISVYVHTVPVYSPFHLLIFLYKYIIK